LFVDDRNLRRKYAAQNAGNGVFGLQTSKIVREIEETRSIEELRTVSFGA
jgi:hypothetical protein